jgi:N utilization substance protein B
MANRHLSRSIVLQTLFEWDFNSKDDAHIEEVLRRNEGEFGPGLEDYEFMHELTELVLKKRTIIDEIIEKAAPEWPLDKISVVDRNILRLGLAELLFGNREQVPPKVAINEAIELAKAFGGETSSKFVNGVLGAVYKEIGEPGKEQTSKKKKDDTPIDITKLPVEKKAGAVIYARTNDAIYLALVHDVFGYWTLSKGGVDGDEAEDVAVVREINDELGLPIQVLEKLGESEYIASHPEKGKIRKVVHFFLAEAPYQDLKLSSSGGLDGARWFPLHEIGEIKTYDDILPLLAKAVEIITK